MKRRRFLETLAVAPLATPQLTSTAGFSSKPPADVQAASGSSNLKPWAQAVAEAWTNASRAIILSDMSLSRPSSALSPRLRRHRWKIISYETVDKIKGNLIWAAVEAQAPAVEMSLEGAKGWHAIFVGVYSTVNGPSKVWLKMNSDMAAQPRVAGEFRPYGSFTEVFFKVADLDGSSLRIEPQCSGQASDCGVVWVKLIPLTSEEVAGFLADRDQPSDGRLAATNDSGFLDSNRPTTAEEILREVEVFRHTDFDTLLLHLPGADGVRYPSRHGFVPALLAEDGVYPAPGYRYCAESVAELARKGINPFKVLIDGAHQVGMKVHIATRPALWTYYEPFQEFFESPFYRAHPEWRCADRDGTPVARMSWAVPEVRKHLIDVLREGVALGADGAHLVFCRGVPVVLYEQPFLEIFQQQHRQDPRNLNEESDPRIRKAWAEIVTQFLREARAMLDQERARRGSGRRLELSAMIFGNEHDNLIYGIDVRNWVEEGLIDEIFTYRWNIGAKRAVEDTEFFLKICRPKRVAYRPGFSVSPGYTKIEEAIPWLEQGVDGFGFFDVSSVTPYIEKWVGLSRLGHKAELPFRQNLASERSRQIRFHRLGDQVMDGRFPPWWGG